MSGSNIEGSFRQVNQVDNWDEPHQLTPKSEKKKRGLGGDKLRSATNSHIGTDNLKH